MNGSSNEPTPANLVVHAKPKHQADAIRQNRRDCSNLNRPLGIYVRASDKMQLIVMVKLFTCVLLSYVLIHYLTQIIIRNHCHSRYRLLNQLIPKVQLKNSFTLEAFYHDHTAKQGTYVATHFNMSQPFKTPPRGKISTPIP